MKKSWLLLALSLSVFSFIHPTGFHGYVSFKGSKQGQLKGESTNSARKDKTWFELASFDFGGELPVDASRSAAAGKRTHRPFLLTKKVDDATPKLLQAHQTNELFETVVVQTVNDQDQPTKTITLKNALISSIKTNGNIESISFTYDAIEQQ